MSCEQTEKVSALMDGELPAKESGELRLHIKNCEECTGAMDDFLFMRRQIKGLTVDEQTYAPPKPVFFRRRIAIPAPVFAVGLLIFAGLIGTLIMTRSADPSNAAKTNPQGKTETSTGSLARFDSGGKAEIYKEARR